LKSPDPLSQPVDASGAALTALLFAADPIRSNTLALIVGLRFHDLI
jgi:hypothetical protein